MKDSYWFYLEPYVSCVLKNDYLVLYNPLNGKILEYRNTPKIFRLVRDLQSNDNLLVIKLLSEDFNITEIADFVERVKECFMGDLLDADWFISKPVQVVPEIKMIRNANKISNNVDSALPGFDIITNLTEISFYINGFQNIDSQLFSNGYKQFLCFSNQDKANELSVDEIERSLNEAVSSSLFRINILGGNIFRHSDFKKLTTFLNEIPLIKAYFFHYLDVVDYRDSFDLINKDVDFIPNDIKWELNMFFHLPLKEEPLKNALKIVKAAGMNTKYHFIVEKEEDITEAEKVIVEYGLTDYSFLPYYNGSNLDFFENAVFVTKEEIVDSRPQQKDILARQVINQVNFGKLTVLSNGNIHANVNEPVLGKLGHDSLYDVIYKELRQGNSWRRTRGDIQPCKECVFQYLCPSPSNYEYALGRNNLCHIWNKE